jgi:hypothetical protein
MLRYLAYKIYFLESFSSEQEKVVPKLRKSYGTLHNGGAVMSIVDLRQLHGDDEACEL